MSSDTAGNFPFDTILLYRTLVFSAFFAATCIIATFVYNRRKYVSLINKIPGPRVSSYSPFGNIGLLGVFGRSNKHIPLLASVFERVLGLHKLYGEEGLSKLWLGHVAAVAIQSSEMAEFLLSSNTLIDKSEDYNLLHSWLGTGLLTSTGSKWKQRRKLLTPAFHFRILDDSLVIINENSLILNSKLLEASTKDYINIITPVSLCALDIICETAMGMPIHAQKESDSLYIKSIHAISQSSIDRGPKWWLWNEFLFGLTKMGKEYKKNLAVVHGMTRKVISAKKASFKAAAKYDKTEDFGKKKRLAFLDILLNEHMNNNNIITEEDIREEVDTFLFEGHDTTAVGMSWALYLIGLHPEVQEKITDELQTIFGDDTERPVTFEDLKQMKYLECVIKESLRLYPSVPYIGRRIAENTQFGPYLVPKGSRMWLLIYNIHRDPRVFPDPEAFKPERFFIENSSEKNPFSYIPFSAGPRNCIGQKFAMMEEKTVISNVLRRFCLKSLDARDKVIPSAEVVLRPVNGIRMRVTPRK